MSVEVVRPSGTVTFLFTDVEGSTRLWASDADAMARSLRIHDELLRRVVEGRGGYVFTTAGDSFAVAFSRPSDAVAAATEIQDQLSEADWGDGPPLAVRMGLHLGEADERAGDYFGPAVNTAARVEAAGHGGQVLLTGVVKDAAGVIARDLGVHRLRDVGEPVHLFQLGEREFAPLRGLTRSEARLPRQRNRLVGRDADISTVMALLTDEVLVTITGPGGSGKTRLAIEVAGGVADRFDGHVYFIDLASVQDAGAVHVALARSLELPLEGGRAPLDQILDSIGERRMLLVWDNCEHLLEDVAVAVERVLDRCPGVVVLATSREVLDVEGERVFRAPPLDSSSPRSPAVRLFVERAASAAPDFVPSETQLGVIARICERLDGMPLAIELAAARVRTLSVSDIEHRLDARLDLLSGGRRGRIRRQQTLRETIEWSVDLLTPDERRFLRRLGVFVDGWTLEAAGPVTQCTENEAIDLLDSLVAKSLVERIPTEEGGTRYRLLETLREWALEDCIREENLHELRLGHAVHFASRLATEPHRVWNSPEFLDAWIDELPNIVAATDFVVDRDVDIAAELLVRFRWEFVPRGRGDWYVDRILQCLNGDLSPELGPVCLFAARTSLELGMRLADQARLPAKFREPVPGERYHGSALNSYWTEYHRVWSQPFERSAQIDRAIAEYSRGSVPVDIRALFVGLRTYVGLFTHQFADAVTAALESLPHQPSDLMVRNAAAVAAHLGADHRAGELIVDFSEFLGVERSWDWVLPYRVLIDEAIEHKERAIVEHVTRQGSSEVPAVESDYLVVLARLAYLRGDHERARELFSGVRLRQPATFGLLRWTLSEIEGQPIDVANQPAQHTAHLARAASVDHPDFHGAGAGASPPLSPQQRERQLLLSEIARWA